MHQAGKRGGGDLLSNEAYYTWEMKECPACGRRVLEYYLAIEQEGIIPEGMDITLIEKKEETFRISYEKK